MGTDSTYFFQPGIPSRKNPLTPDENVRLTERLAEHHAEALDEIHSLYYTEESFDDFYYGKGSSYPDAQGTIAILFEQGIATVIRAPVLSRTTRATAHSSDYAPGPLRTRALLCDVGDVRRRHARKAGR